MSSSDVREIEQLLRGLGYTETRNGGHATYDHPEQPTLTLAGTPSDHRWRANMMAELRRRHPELRREKADPAVRAARRRARTARNSQAPVAKPPLTPALTQTEQKRLVSRPSVADREGLVVVGPEASTSPGSPAAAAKGCSCPPVVNNYGRGLDVGGYAIVPGCPLHGGELAETPAFQEIQTCAAEGCRNPLPRRAEGQRGRPRKYCTACNPSEWKRATAEQRELQRARWRRWYAKHRKAA
jgi:predicted RNA binding protein YcfA (HicA-like mRNA interferase family)